MASMAATPAAASRHSRGALAIVGLSVALVLSIAANLRFGAVPVSGTDLLAAFGLADGDGTTEGRDGSRSRLFALTLTLTASTIHQ